MAEDFRAEVIHKWHMRRVDEAIEALRQTVIIFEQDMDSCLQASMAIQREASEQ